VCKPRHQADPSRLVWRRCGGFAAGSVPRLTFRHAVAAPPQTWTRRGIGASRRRARRCSVRRGAAVSTITPAGRPQQKPTECWRECRVHAKGAASLPATRHAGYRHRLQMESIADRGAQVRRSSTVAWWDRRERGKRVLSRVAGRGRAGRLVSGIAARSGVSGGGLHFTCRAGHAHPGLTR
jgi:hypothetical protein